MLLLKLELNIHLKSVDIMNFWVLNPLVANLNETVPHTQFQ